VRGKGGKFLTTSTKGIQRAKSWSSPHSRAGPGNAPLAFRANLNMHSHHGIQGHEPQAEGLPQRQRSWPGDTFGGYPHLAVNIVTTTCNFFFAEDNKRPQALHNKPKSIKQAIYHTTSTPKKQEETINVFVSNTNKQF
jgi:hypothetical protein